MTATVALGYRRGMELRVTVIATNMKSRYIWYAEDRAIGGMTDDPSHPSDPFWSKLSGCIYGSLPSREVSSPCNKFIGSPIGLPWPKVNSSLQKTSPTGFPHDLLYLHCSSSHLMAALLFDLFKSKVSLLFSLSYIAPNLAVGRLGGSVG